MTAEAARGKLQVGGAYFDGTEDGVLLSGKPLEKGLKGVLLPDMV